MATLHWKMFGKKDGNFHPTRQENIKFLASLQVARKQLPEAVKTLYLPKAGFTTNIQHLGQIDGWTPPWLVRTLESCDGGIVHKKNIAVGFLTADCPIVCLYQEKEETLVVLHGGYRCLICANPEEKGIVEIAIKHLDKKKTRAFVFGGIGPCCWVPEYEDKPEIVGLAKCRHQKILGQCLTQTNKKSPFGAGHISVNLYALAEKLLIDAGIPSENILIDSTCTCCTKKDHENRWWSYNRYKAYKTNAIAHQDERYLDGRNLSLVWLE